MPDDKFVDPVTLKLTGATEEEVTSKGYKVRPMNLEESWNSNKNFVGDKMNLDQYKILWEETMKASLYDTDKAYKEIASGNKTNTTQLNLIAPKKNVMFVHPEVLGIDTGAEPWELYKPTFSDSKIGGYYNQNGKWQQSMTNEEIAETRKEYYVRTPEGLKAKSMTDYLKTDTQGHPFRIDENGKKHMLVLDPGMKAWIEFDADSVQDSYNLRSIYGPKAAESGIGENMATQAWNTIIDSGYGATGTIAEMMGTATGWITGQDGRNSMQKWGAEMQNYAGGLKSKVSEAVEQEGAFGSWRSGLGTAANAITQVGTQALIGMITGGVGNVTGLSARAAAAGIKGAQTWANLAPRLASKALNGAPWAFGAAYAAQAMNDEAKAAGLDDKSRLMMSTMAMAAVYASEYGLKSMGFSGLVDKFDDAGLAPQVHKAFKGRMNLMATEIKNELAGTMDDAAISQVIKTKVDDAMVAFYKEQGIDLTATVKGSMVQNMARRVASWQYSDKPGSLAARLVAGGLAGVEEGLEENFEGIVNSWSKFIYNNGFADPDAKPGQGKFQNVGWEDPIGEFFGGFIGGSVMGLARGLRKKVNVKDYGVANIAMMTKGDRKTGLQMLNDMYEMGVPDNPLLDENGQFMQALPADKKGSAKSLNDLAYKQMVQQLNTAYDIMEQTGINDPEVINRLMGGDTQLAKDAIVHGLMATRFGIEKTELEKALQAETPGSEKHAEMTARLAEVDEKLEHHKKIQGKIVDGTAVEEYNALQLLRNTAMMVDLQGSIDPKGMSREQVNQAIDNSLTKLEEEESWNDRAGSLETIKNIQAMRDGRAAKLKEIEAARAESKELEETVKALKGDGITTLDVAGVIEALNEIDLFTADTSTSKGKKMVKSQHLDKFTALKARLGQLKQEANDEIFKSGKGKEAYDAEEQILLAGKDKATMSTEELKKLDADTKAAAMAVLDDEALNDPTVEQLMDDHTKSLKPFDEIGKRVDDTQSRLYDDTDKQILGSGKKAIGPNGVQSTGFYDLRDKTDPDYDEFVYQKKTADGKIEDIDRADYLEAQKSTGSTENIFKVGDEEFIKREGFRQQGSSMKQVTVTMNGFDEDGNPTVYTKTENAADISQAGIGLIENKKFYARLMDILSSIQAQGEATKKDIDALDTLLKEIDKEQRDLLILSRLISMRDTLTPAQQKLLGVDLNDPSLFGDIVAYQMALFSVRGITVGNLSDARQNVDTREQMFKDHTKNTIKQAALMHNQLSVNMKQQEIKVNGVVMKRPPMFTMNELDDINNGKEAKVMQAMQYWHYYFNYGNNKAQITEDFTNFWHGTVMNYEFDGGKPSSKMKDDGAMDKRTVSSENQGMFVDDFNDFIKFELFEKQQKGSTYRQQSYYQMMHIILNMDMADYYRNMSQVVDGNYKGAHTPEQLYVLQMAISHAYERNNINSAAADGDTEYLKFHADIKTVMKVGARVDAAIEAGQPLFSLFDLPMKNGKLYYDGSHIRDNFLLLVGPGGAGKTSFLVRTIIEATKSHNKPVIIVGPNQTAVDELQKAVDEAGVKAKAMTIDKFLETQHEHENSLIFIDEISRLSRPQRNSLYYKDGIQYYALSAKDSAKALRSDGTVTGEISDTNTVYLLGDEFQAPPNPASNESPFALYMQHAFTLTQVKRTDYKDIFSLQAAFRMEIAKKGNGQGVPVISKQMKYTVMPDGSRRGVQLEDNKESFFAAAKRVNDEPDAFLIVLSEEDAKDAHTNYGIDMDKIKVVTSEDKTPQGMTISEVFVYIPQTKLVKNGGTIDKNNVPINAYNKYMGLAVGRGKNYVMMYSAGYDTQGSVAAEPGELDMFDNNPQRALDKIAELRARMKEVSVELSKTKPMKPASKKVVPKDAPIEPEGETITDDDVEDEIDVVEETVVEDPLPSSVDSKDLAINSFNANGNYAVNKSVKVTINKIQKDVRVTEIAHGAFDDATQTLSSMVTAIDAEGNTYLIYTKTKGAKVTRDKTVKHRAPVQNEPTPYEEQEENDGNHSGMVNDPEAQYVNPIIVKTTDDDKIEHTVTYVDPKTGLMIQVGGRYSIEGSIGTTDYEVMAIRDVDGVLSVDLQKLKVGPKGNLIRVTVGAGSKLTLSVEQFIGKKGVKMHDKSIEALTQRHFKDLLNNNELYLSNRFLPFDGKKSYNESVIELTQRINRIIGSRTIIAYRVRIINNAIQGRQFSGHTEENFSPDYVYVIEYQNANGEFEEVGYISTTDNNNNNNAFYAALARKASRLLSTSTEESIVVATGNVSANKAAELDGVIARKGTDKKLKQVTATSLINTLRKMGYKVSAPAQVRNETSGRAKTILIVELNGNTTSVSIEAKHLDATENVEKARGYLQNIIDTLESLNSDNSIKAEFNQGGNFFQFFEYNKSQIRTDMNGTPKPQYLTQEVQNIFYLHDGYYKLFNPNALKGSRDKAVTLLKSILANLGSGTLRFAPLMKNGELDSADYALIDSNYLKPPAIKVPLGESSDFAKGLHRQAHQELEAIQYDTTREEAVKEILSILGDNVPDIGFVSDMLSRENAHGKLTDLGKLLLNYHGNMVSSRVIYHEVAHYVAEFLTPDLQRRSLYEEVARKNGMKDFDYDDIAQRKQAAEYFALMAERYASDRRNLTGISKLFKSFMDTLKFWFRNLGIIKNVTDRYLYDIFVANKYKRGSLIGQVGTQDMMPYHELLRADDFQEMSKVEKHFGDRFVGMEAAQEIAYSVSMQTTAPILNSRLFKDKIVSFQDVINRIENSTRQTVMYQTDKDGNIMKHPAGHDFAGMPMLRLDDEGNPIQLEINKKMIPLFKYEDNVTDENNVIHTGTQLMYYDVKAGKYRLAKKNSKGILFSGKYARNNIRLALRQAMGNFVVETGRLDADGEFEYAHAMPNLGTEEGIDMQGALLSKGSMADYWNFRYAVAALDDNVLAAMINRYFPNVNARTMIKGQNKNMTFTDQLNKLMEAEDILTRQNNSQVNPMDRQSAMLKFILSTLPAYKLIEVALPFEMDEQAMMAFGANIGAQLIDGKLYTWKATGGKIYHERASSVMMNIKMTSFDPSLSTIDAFRAALNSEMVKLANYEGSPLSINNNETYVIMKSIYDQFFADGDGPVSHYKIVKWHEQVLEGTRPFDKIYAEYSDAFSLQQSQGMIASTEPKLTEEQFRDMIGTRASHSGAILNAMVSHFGSMATNQYLTGYAYGYDAKGRVYIRFNDANNEIDKKREFEDHIDATISEEDNSTIREGIKNVFGFNDSQTPLSPDGKRPAKTIFKEDGVYYRDYTGTDTKFIDIKDGRFQRVDKKLFGENLNTEQAIKSMMLEIFNKEFSNKALGALANNMAPEELGWHNFHSTFGPMFLATYTYVAERVYDVDKRPPLYEIYSKILENFKPGNANYGRRSPTAMENIRNGNPDGGPMDVDQVTEDDPFHPNGYFEELAAIGKMLVITEGGQKVKIGKTVKGRKMFYDQQQDPTGYHLNDGGTSYAEAFQERMEAGGASQNFNQRGGRIFNPFLGSSRIDDGILYNEAVPFVRDMPFMNGMKHGFNGVEISDMSEKNGMDFALAAFMDGSDGNAESWSYKPQFIMQYNQGERSQQRMFSLNWNVNGYSGNDNRKNSTGILIKNDDGTFTVDGHNQLHHTLNVFSMLENAQVYSLNRWVNFLVKTFGNSPMGGVMISNDLLIDMNEPGWRQKRTEVLDALKEFVLPNLLATEGLPTDGDNAMFHIVGDSVMEFDGMGMTRGVDYNIVKSSGMTYIYLGHDTTMNSAISRKGKNTKFSPIRTFNWHNYTTKKFTTYVDKVPYSFTMSEMLDSMDENGNIAMTYMDDKTGTLKKKELSLEEKNSFLRKLYGAELNEMQRGAVEKGYKLYKDNMKGTDLQYFGKSEGIMTNSTNFYTPWVGYTMAHSIFNAYYMMAYEGTYAQEMDNVIDMDKDGHIKWTGNNNKRSMQHSSPIRQGAFEGMYGMDQEGYRVVLGEITMPAAVYGMTSIEEKAFATFDGQSFENPFNTILRYNAHGKQNGDINRNGARKSQGILMDNTTGQSAKKKHAGAIDSLQSMMLMPEHREMFMFMNNPYLRPYAITEELRTELPNKQSVIPALDSLWQRYLIYEHESRFKDAVTAMENFMENTPGGTEAYIRNAFADTIKNNDEVARILEDFKKFKKDNFLYTQYDLLVSIMELAGDQEYIEEPGGIDYNYAIDEVAEFYYVERKAGRASNYPYLSDFGQNAATEKHKATGNTIPIKFEFGGQTNNIRPMDWVKDVNGNSPLTPDGEVPTDLFSMIQAWKNHPEDFPFDKIATRFDRTDEGEQLNANRDIDDAQESPMVQIMNVILASGAQHENGQSDKLISKLAESIRLGMQRFEDRVEAYSDKVKALSGEEEMSVDLMLQTFIKEQIRKNMSSIDDGSMLSVIINNPKININISAGLQERVFQYLASYFKKHAVKSKMAGMRLVQLGGNNIHLYEYQHQNGTIEVFNGPDAIIYAEKMLGVNVESDGDLAALGFGKRTLKNTTIQRNEEEGTAEQQDMIKQYNAAGDMKGLTRYLIEQKLAVVSKGEAVVPAPKYDKYSIPKHVTFNQLFRLYAKDGEAYTDIQLKEMASKSDRKGIKDIFDAFTRSAIAFSLIPGKKGNHLKIQHTGSQKGDNAYFDSLVVGMIGAHIKGNKKLLSDIVTEAETLLVRKTGGVLKFEKKYIVDGQYDESYYNDIQEYVNEAMFNHQQTKDLLTELSDMYTSGLIATMSAAKDSLGIRTPSGPGSGFYVDIVQFVNDNSSVGYVNTIKNLIDGSDQDIDQFTMYYLSDSMKQLGYSEEEAAAKLLQMKENGYDEAIIDDVITDNNNDLMQLLFDYYNDPNNNYLTGSPIGMGAIKRTSQNADSIVFPDGEFAHNFFHSLVMRRQSFDGQVVGPIAQGQKVQTWMAKSFWANASNAKVLNLDLYPLEIDLEGYRSVPARVEGATNAATDNKKLMYLGAMGINFDNADAVTAGLFMMGEVAMMVKANYQRYGITDEQMALYDNPDEDFGDEDLYYHFFMGQGHKDVMKHINSMKDIFSTERKPKLYKATHNYISKIFKYDADNKAKALKLDGPEGDIIRYRTAIENRLLELGIDPIYVQELKDTGKIDVYKLISKVAKSGGKAIHKVVGKIIDAEIANRLSKVGDEEMVADIKEEIKGMYSNADRYELLEMKLGETPSTTTESAMRDSLAATEAIKDLLNNARKLIGAKKELDRVQKYLSQDYQGELMMLAKIAMLGEWMRNVINIVDINQYKITSAFDVYKFKNNFKQMTGYEVEVLLDIYEDYKAAKESTHETPYEYLARTGNSMNNDKLWQQHQEMYKHSMADKEYKHLTEPLELNDKKVSFSEQFYSIGNVAALLMAQDHVMKMLGVVKVQDDLNKQLNIAHRDEFQRTMKTMMDETGIDFYNEGQYRSYFDEVHNYMTSYYLNVDTGEGGIHELLRESLARISDGVGGNYENRPLIGLKSAVTGTVFGIVPQIGTAPLRQDFIKQFPQFFELVIKPRLTELAAAGKLNDDALDLIEKLYVQNRGTMQFIEVQNTLNQSPDQMELLRAGFRALPEEIRNVLAIYQIAKSGFEYTRGFLAKVMPEEFYEKYSRFVDKFMADPRMNDAMLNRMKMQMLANPNLKMSRQAVPVTTSEGGKTVKNYAPPIGAYGYVKYFTMPAHIEYRGKFGTSKIEVLGETTQSDYVGYGRAKGRSENAVSSNAVIDINTELMPNGTEVAIMGRKIRVNGLTMAAYLYYEVKKQANLIISRMVAKEIEGGAELTEADVDNFIAENLSVEKMNKGARSETSYIAPIEVDEEKETYADALERVSKAWVRTIAQALKRKYDAATFNELVEGMKGKIFTGDSIKNQLAMPVQLSQLFNYLTATDGDYHTNLDNAAIMMDGEQIPKAEVLFWRNRLTAIGNSYDRFITDEHIVQMHVGRHDRMIAGVSGKLVGDGTKHSDGRKYFERGLANTIARSFVATDDVYLEKAMQGGSMTEVFGDVDTFREALNNFSDVWIEWNIPYSKVHEHLATANKMRANINAVLENPQEFALRMQSSSGTIYQIGDIVKFADGTDGVVTNLYDPIYNQAGNIIKHKTYEYVINPNVGHPQIFQAKASMEGFLEKNNARRVAEAMTTVFARSMPNIAYEFIGNEQANEMGQSQAASFFYKGQVYINLDKADVGVALHEFAHPLVFALKKENPALYNRLASQVAADEQVMSWVRNNYPELVDEADILNEAIPTYFQMRYYAHERLGQSEAERNNVSEFFNWVASSFTTAVAGEIVTDSSVSALDMEMASLNDIADAVINDFMNGRLLSNIRSEEIAHMVPYAMKAATSSAVKNISLQNIDRLFQSKADYSDQAEARAYTQNLINKVSSEGGVYEGSTGRYNFSFNNPKYYTAGLFDNAKFEEAKNKAITNEMLAYESVSSRMIDFLTGINKKDSDVLGYAIDTIHQNWKKKHDLENATDGEIEALRKEVDIFLMHIGYNSMTDRAMTLNDAMQLLGIKLPTNIKGNPLVIIHDMGQENQAISILTITATSMKHTGNDDLKVLGDAYAYSEELSSKDKRKARAVTLFNTNRDMNAMKNAVIGMAIKKAMPGINIRKVGSVKIDGSEKGYQTHFKRMSDIVVPLKALFSVEHLRENLERDLYDLVIDDSVFDPNQYKRDALLALRQYAATELAQSDDIKDKARLQDMLDTIAHVQEDHVQSQMGALTKALLSRILYMRNQVYNNDETLLSNSEEYQELTEIYMTLTAYRDKGVNKVTPIDFDEKWLKTADRWHGQIRTWVFDSLDLGMRKAKALLMPFQSTMNQKVKELNKINPQINMKGDNAHKLFKNLFKTKQVKGEDGKMHEVSTHEIHWDENDIETKALLNSGKLTRTELNFGKWLADTLYEEFIQYIMDIERSSLVSRVNEQTETIREKAIRVVNMRYKKGMVPVFTKTFGAALNEGKLSEALKLFTETAGRWYGGNIYQDYAQSDNEMQSGKFQELLSPFWSQFTNATNYGSDNRLKLLGLGIDGDGNLKLMNEGKQKALSFNLQNVGLFTMAASLRARNLKEGVTHVNLALDMLRGEETLKGVQVAEIISNLENYVNRQVYGNLPSTGKMMLMGAVVNIDSALDASGRFIHMCHLAMNPLLGAKNMSSAALKLVINGLTNSMSGFDGFGIGDATKAVMEVISNPKKVELLNRKYQLVDITERDLINHWTNNLSKKNLTETDFQMFFHYFGDHYTQLIGAVAQMMQEGTYDAHDNDCNYDVKKDTRIYNPDGTYVEGGKVLEEDIMRQQLLEKYNLPEEGKLIYAYSQRDENRVKVVTQRFVGELNDNQFKNMMSSYGLARAAMSLKNWMYNVKQHWFSERRPEVFLGKRGVMDAGGKEKVVWEPVMVEGVLQTLWYMTKYTKAKLTGDPIPWEMDKWRKRNIISAIAATGVMAAVYFVVDMLSDGFDDDDDKRTAADESLDYFSRTVKMMSETGYVVSKDQDSINYGQQVLRYVMAGAANEQLVSMNPYHIYREFVKNPSTYYMQIENTYDAFWGTILLPWTIASEEDKMQAMGEWAYETSRAMPLGSNYRMISNAVQKNLDDYQTLYKQ